MLPAQVRVRVLNASGVNGAAGRRSPSSSSTASPRRAPATPALRDQTEIRYRPGNEDKALLVAGYMQGVGKAVGDDSITDADVVVYSAKDFKGVKKLTKKDLATTTTTRPRSRRSRARPPRRRRSPADGC